MGPYGTIGQWSCFPWDLGRTRPGPETKRLKRHTRKCKWAVAPNRPGYSLNNFSFINSSLKYPWLCVHHTICRCVFVSFLCVVLWAVLEMGPGEQKWASKSIIHIFFLWSIGEWGQWSRFFFESMSTSTVDIDRRPIFLVWGHIDGRYRPIFLVWIHINCRFRLIFCWNWRSMRYRPYFQVGESLSTVDIDRIVK